MGAVTSRKQRQFHAARKTVRYVCVGARAPISSSFCSNSFRLETFYINARANKIAYAKVGSAVKTVGCRVNILTILITQSPLCSVREFCDVLFRVRL